MGNPTAVLRSLQQRRQRCARRAACRCRCGLVAIALVLTLAPLLYGADLPPSPLEGAAVTAAATAAVTAAEQRQVRRVPVSPTCSAEQERWYIEVRYRYRDLALDIWRLRFSLADATEVGGWQREFNAVIHRDGESLPIYHSLLPSMPSELIIDSGERRMEIVEVACRPYHPFPSVENSTTIHAIDTATLVAQNDFAHSSNKGNNQDFFLYRWSHFPSMLIVDTASYQTLGRLFNRLAFFIEKRGSAGTLYNDAELVGRFAWNGHNYNADDLSRFYNTAEERRVKLNREELQLRDILVAHGVLRNAHLPLRTEDDRYAAGEGGVVAVSHQAGSYARRLILQHELLHALFYASDKYRAVVEQVWLSLSDEERRGWRALLGHLTYDSENEYVVTNEFQAYLLAKPAAESIAQMTAVAQAAATDEGNAIGLAALVASNSASMRKSATQLALLLRAYSGLAPGSLRNVEGEG